MGLAVTEKNTIAQIEEALDSAKKTDRHLQTTDKQDAAATTTAKAGKRSAKAIKEAEAKAAKEARKEAAQAKSAEVDQPAKPAKRPQARPRVERHGKKYLAAAKLVDRGKFYPLTEALELAVKTSAAKFDASIEMHARLSVDPRQADQNVRATLSLPEGTGKRVRVAVLAPTTAHQAAKDAGADIVGDDELLNQLEAGRIDFDVLIAAPQLMPRLGKYAKLLGPRGLMPNPKSGTVNANPAAAVKAAKAGRVEYRVDKQSIVHLAIGKASFGGQRLLSNAQTFLDSLFAAKPAGLSDAYIKSLSVSATMGPGIKIDVSSLQ